MRTGLDRLLAEPAALAGRRYGLLAHGASLSSDMLPAHLALAGTDAGPPAAIFGPEHGFYGVEQDMVPSDDARDAWTGAPIRSLYGESSGSLRPRAEQLADLDLLLIDLQDVGSRYYTYGATAVWAAEVALERGLPVWLLDRPNPLGGTLVEGNLRRDAQRSFVGAFPHPVRHGLTLGEIARLELSRRGLGDGLRVWTMEGWSRPMLWPDTGRPWVAPSPNMPTFETAVLYPGLCLVEGTEVSEGRGTARPLRLVGAPGLDGPALAARLASGGHPGVRFVPTRFRPAFQKHADLLCEGVEVVVEAAPEVRPYRLGVDLLAALHERLGEALWRRRAYEFVTDQPAIDLLAGDPTLRQQLAEGRAPEAWIAGWAADEAAFRRARRASLLYPEEVT